MSDELWRDIIAEIFDEAGIEATSEQIDCVAKGVHGTKAQLTDSHQFGSPRVKAPERPTPHNWICAACNGTRKRDYGTTKPGPDTCDICDGEGRIYGSLVRA